MSALDLPPGIGLTGTPLGVFSAPRRARRLALVAIVAVTLLGALTWYFVKQHWWRRGMATNAMAPLVLWLVALLGLAVRSARLAITRDGVRWGWTVIGFHQPAGKIATAHVYRDGVALEAKRGSWWFLGARDWDRYDALVRQLRRADLPVVEHAGKAPLRARLQSYGRFLDAMLIATIVGAIVFAMRAA